MVGSPVSTLAAPELSEAPDTTAVLGQLVFAAMWLAAWTLLVCMLQVAALRPDPSAVSLLALAVVFAVELGLLLWQAVRIGEAADPMPAPALEHHHDRLEARWSLGGGSLALVAAGAVITGVVHLALFASLGVGVRLDPAPWQNALALFLALCWAGSGQVWIGALLQQRRARGDVELRADLDGVDLRFRGPLAARSTKLPLLGLRVDRSRLPRGILGLAVGIRAVDVPIQPGEEADALVDVLRRMAEGATPARELVVPEALRGLRLPTGEQQR